MTTEKLIEKGVEKHFNGQQVLFKVDSLKEHFDGLQIHKTDILSIEDVDYVKPTDVDFSVATANEVGPKQEEVVTTELTPEEADELIKSENLKIGIVSDTDENAKELTKVDSELQPKTPIEEIVVVDTEEVSVENKAPEPIIETPKPKAKKK